MANSLKACWAATGSRDTDLPRSLSDEWLEMVSQSVEDMLDGVAGGTASISLAAIVCILLAKMATRN